MAFFGFGKKKEPKPCCCCNASAEEQNTTSGCCCNSEKGSICCIKVLGAGCKSCRTQFENAQAAVKELALDIEVEYITDMEKIMEYGVMSMPAIVVNEKVASFGKVLSVTDVRKLLEN